MPSTRLEFVGSQGDLLSGLLDLPGEGTPRAYALFAHCFTCHKYYKAVHYIDRVLAEAQIACLRFDFTGLGESEGDFAETSFSSNVADLVVAARFLEEQYEPPKILIGHSLGGAAVIQAAPRIPSSLAVVTIAAPADTTHLHRVLLSKKEEIERYGEAEIVVGGRRFKVRKQFLDDLAHTTMQETIAGLGRALLVLHSPDDTTVSIDNAMRIYAAAGYPKALVSVDGADHLLLEEHDASYVGRVIAAWVSRYLG